jgi:hypothetical protein
MYSISHNSVGKGASSRNSVKIFLSHGSIEIVAFLWGICVEVMFFQGSVKIFLGSQ